MAQITLTYTIPDDKIQQYKDWFCFATNMPDGENQNAWIKEEIRKVVIGKVRLGEMRSRTPFAPTVNDGDVT